MLFFQRVVVAIARHAESRVEILRHRHRARGGRVLLVRAVVSCDASRNAGEASRGVRSNHVRGTRGCLLESSLEYYTRVMRAFQRDTTTLIIRGVLVSGFTINELDL